MPCSQTGQADCGARTWKNEQQGALKPFAYLFCATSHSPLDACQEAGPAHMLMSCHAEMDGLTLAISKLNSQLHVNCHVLKTKKSLSALLQTVALRFGQKIAAHLCFQ